MRELAVEHVADDLHVAMPMGAEALPARHAIFVEHAQRPELHVVLVEIIREGEAVVGLEPAVIGMAAICTASDDFHGNRLYPFSERRT